MFKKRWRIYCNFNNFDICFAVLSELFISLDKCLDSDYNKNSLLYPE